MKTYSLTEVTMMAGHSVEKKTLFFAVSMEKAIKTRDKLEDKLFDADFDASKPIVSYLILPSCLS